MPKFRFFYIQLYENNCTNNQLNKWRGKCKLQETKNILNYVKKAQKEIFF